MFRSPADKAFLKTMGLVILIAEIVVIGVSYAIFGAPYWPILAILGGAAVFAAVIGFSVLFGPDYNTFSPWPRSLPRPLRPRGVSRYPGYGPRIDPRERIVRQREADERMARDETAAVWLGLNKRDRANHGKPSPEGRTYLIWTFGPLVAVILVVALLIWGGLEATP